MNLPSADAVIPVLQFEEIDSTNAEGRRRAEAGEPGPLWISADRQVAGRGRRGRVWESPTGNLAATLLMTLEIAPAEASSLAFVAALAVADLASESVPDTLVTVKWPNDVMVEARKVAGILIESGRAPSGCLWLAIGIGVNLAAPPVAAERPATALAHHLRADRSRAPNNREALALLSARFLHWAEVWRTQGVSAILAAWSERAQGMNELCLVRSDRETLEGIAEGLDPDGALRLRLPDRTIRRITAGEVFFPGGSPSGAA